MIYRRQTEQLFYMYSVDVSCIGYIGLSGVPNMKYSSLRLSIEGNEFAFALVL